MRGRHPQGCRLFCVQGSRFKVQGSRFKVQSSRFKGGFEVLNRGEFKIQDSKFKRGFRGAQPGGIQNSRGGFARGAAQLQLKKNAKAALSGPNVCSTGVPTPFLRPVGALGTTNQW